MPFAPLAGGRHVEVTARRTTADVARVLRDRSDTYRPQASEIVPGTDDRNAHRRASRCEAFPAAEARRLAARLEVHDTPEHGRWRDLAETEPRVPSRPCPDRRIDGAEELAREIAAWERKRNAAGTTVDWQFTAPDARIKLKRLDPSIEVG